MAEVPSDVREGPDKAIQSLVVTVERVLGLTGAPITAVRAVGLDMPGPASADGVISSKGATNFGHIGWRGFDIRGALAERLGLPVIYNNDENSAALYAHHVRFGAESGQRSSVAAIVGTVVALGIALATRVAGGGTSAIMLVSGAVDAAATICYVLAIRVGLFGLAVVITSLYPGMTVLLVRWVLGERMRWLQRGRPAACRGRGDAADRLIRRRPR